MTWPLIDAHCHLHDEHLHSFISSSSIQRFENVLSRARSVHVSHIVSCATHEEDWRILEQLMEQQKHDSFLTIVPVFGVHPWWAQEMRLIRSSAPLKTLRDMLILYPKASVGEIGLCKSKKGRQVPVNIQMETFRVQLDLAAELERTCVLHCVGYYGKLLNILRDVDPLPPVLVLHSYSGSLDMIPSFLALRGTRVFFSLNAKQLTDPQMKKAAACCKKLPLESLLLETDAPDQTPSIELVKELFNQADNVPLALRKGSAGVNEPAMVKLALYGAAKIRNVPMDEVAAAVYQNSKEAFGLMAS
ncbi:unnamed protein product [Peronospora effusa]|uniref:TatD related DNase n=1 Tax=Peronospora effusa TaxID=542832 RepID=A0A3M6VJR7_9STRA|nr:hypothetical protein DD238_004023 [Peronospora effusa]RQM14292.1 hypothetical protein DD237_005133 [Peronospora effusa]CAI5701167.1 unnamed protein product [Peronospora effusa]